MAALLLIHPAEGWMEPGEFLVRPRDVARVCAVCIGLLLALHLASQIARFGFGRDYQLGLAIKVYLGSESSIPNWFSTILLLACAAVLFAIGSGAPRADAMRWRVLGAVFVALSLDEAAALHDLASPVFAGVFTRLAAVVGGPFVALARKPNYAWEIPGAIVAAVVGLAYVPFLTRLPRSTRNGFVLAGIVYVGAAVGIDFIEGWYSGLHGPRNPLFVALLTCEETLEMVGASIFLYTLLRYAEAEIGEMRIRLSAADARPVAQRAGTTPAAGTAAITSISSISSGRARRTT